MKLMLTGHAITETWLKTGVLCPPNQFRANMFTFVQRASERIASYKEKTGVSRSS